MTEFVILKSYSSCMEHTKADILGLIIVEICIQIVLKSAETVMLRKYVKDEMKRKARLWSWESWRCLMQ